MSASDTPAPWKPDAADRLAEAIAGMSPECVSRAWRTAMMLVELEGLLGRWPAADVRRVLTAPRVVAGGLGRLVGCADGAARVEAWGAGGWARGGADIAEVLEAPDAPRDLLLEFAKRGRSGCATR